MSVCRILLLGLVEERGEEEAENPWKTMALWSSTGKTQRKYPSNYLLSQERGSNQSEWTILHGKRVRKKNWTMTRYCKNNQNKRVREPSFSPSSFSHLFLLLSPFSVFFFFFMFFFPLAVFFFFMGLELSTDRFFSLTFTRLSPFASSFFLRLLLLLLLLLLLPLLFFSSSFSSSSFSSSSSTSSHSLSLVFWKVGKIGARGKCWGWSKVVAGEMKKVKMKEREMK